jgi:hypothetical protein
MVPAVPRAAAYASDVFVVVSPTVWRVSMSPSLEPVAMPSIVVKRVSRASAAGDARVAAAAIAWQKSFGFGGAAEGSVVVLEEHAESIRAAATARVATRFTRLV